jgi:DNA polymerase
LSPAAHSDGTRTLSRLAELRAAVNACRRCELWRAATQGVPGEGRADAPLMLVGEAPGDVEDIEGHPFVGPAGLLLDRALAAAGIPREDAFISNAVKHFRYERRGKRRLHAKPDAAHIRACNWWLSEELRLLAPRMVVALGATAVRALLHRSLTIASVRGRLLALNENTQLIVSVHPSWLLRLREDADRKREFARFVADLRLAREVLQTVEVRHPAKTQRRGRPSSDSKAP